MARGFYMSVILVLIVITAGCVTVGGGAKTKTEIVSKDLVVIKSIDVFPGKQVQPDDTIIVRMEVENTGQYAAYLLVDKDSKGGDILWNGDYLLIDHCSSLYNKFDEAQDMDAEFQILSGVACEAVGADIPHVKDSAGNEISEGSCYVRVAPQQSHTFQWTLKAPSAAKIAQMTHRCTFKFQTAYASQAVTNTYVYFADPLELAQRLYTKKELALAGDNIASYGPIAANFETAEPQPIPARTNSADGTPGKWTVFLNLKNVGVGLADVNRISVLLPSGVETFKTTETSSEPGASRTFAMDNCLMGGTLDGAVLNNQLAIVEAVSKVVTAEQSTWSALSMYGALCNPGQFGITAPAPAECSETSKSLVSTYLSGPCADPAGDNFCSSKYPAVKSQLEDMKRLLQINAQASSRIPCTLTIPSGVSILTPFKFVTVADYTYKIRRDIEITTKPIKEIVR